MLSADDARRLDECLGAGGVALFPADTVYGLACDPDSPDAVARLYDLKGRPPRRPSAVMFFGLAPALETLPDLAASEREALTALLPGPVTLLLPNRARRFGPACAGDPDTLGLRVPALDAAIEALGAVPGPAMQSSANLSGGSEAAIFGDVPAKLRAGVDLGLDGGPRPGVASTVVVLRAWEREGRFEIVRAGALSEAVVASLLPS